MKNPTIKFPESLARPTEVLGGLNGGVRDSRSVAGGSKQSEASVPDGPEDSKSIRPGRPVKSIVRAVLRGLNLQHHRG